MNTYIEVEISNDPISGFKRKVFMDYNGINFKGEVIDLRTQVVYYKDEAGAYGDFAKDDAVLNKNNRFNDMDIRLTTSGRYIDSVTGLDCTSDAPNAIPEFTYMSKLTPIGIGLTGNDEIFDILKVVYISTIQKRDSEGSFD